MVEADSTWLHTRRCPGARGAGWARLRSEDLGSRGASVFMQATAFMGRPSGSASLTTRLPPCARSYLGSCSSGNDELARPSQAADEEECLSPPAVVTDAQEALFWTSAASRVWVAAVWSQSMYSGISPRLCGKPVWWAPQHDGVAGSGQVRVYAAGIGPLGSELASSKPMQMRRGGALAPRRTSTILAENPRSRRRSTLANCGSTWPQRW